jgi:hypothetical protein
VFFGISTVSNGYADASNTGGWSLEENNTEGVTLDFRRSGISVHRTGSVPFSSFYVDAATSGDDVDWIALTE